MRSAVNREVGGFESPGMRSGHVVRTEERCPCKAEAAGSNPARSIQVINMRCEICGGKDFTSVSQNVMGVSHVCACGTMYRKGKFYRNFRSKRR